MPQLLNKKAGVPASAPSIENRNTSAEMRALVNAFLESNPKELLRQSGLNEELKINDLRYSDTPASSLSSRGLRKALDSGHSTPLDQRLSGRLQIARFNCVQGCHGRQEHRSSGFRLSLLDLSPTSAIREASRLTVTSVALKPADTSRFRLEVASRLRSLEADTIRMYGEQGAFVAEALDGAHKGKTLRFKAAFSSRSLIQPTVEELRSSAYARAARSITVPKEHFGKLGYNVSTGLQTLGATSIRFDKVGKNEDRIVILVDPSKTSEKMLCPENRISFILKRSSGSVAFSNIQGLSVKYGVTLTPNSARFDTDGSCSIKSKWGIGLGTLVKLLGDPKTIAAEIETMLAGTDRYRHSVGEQAASRLVSTTASGRENVSPAAPSKKGVGLGSFIRALNLKKK